MAATAASIFAGGISSGFRWDMTTRRVSISTEQQTMPISSGPTTFTVTTGTNLSDQGAFEAFEKGREVGKPKTIKKWSLSLLEEIEDLEMKTRKSLRDYFDEASDLKTRENRGERRNVGELKSFGALGCMSSGLTNL